MAPAIILSAIDQTIVATALPAIAADLGAVESLSWVVVAYLIAATVAAPVFGRLGDVFGRQPLLLAALAVNAAGSTLCAVAPSFGVLVVGRLVHGFGGGGLATMAMALIGEAVPPRERGRFQAYIVAAFTTASCLGPIAGGWLTQHLGWRSVFWALLPVMAATVPLARRIPRRPGHHGGGFRFDWPGVLLFAAFVAPGLLALGQVQKANWGALPFALLLLAGAAVALAALLRWEGKAPDALLHLPLLADATVWRANTLTACAHGALVALLTFLPVYLQSVRGLPPTEVGALLLPLSAGGAAGGLSAGWLMTRTGIGMPFAFGGLGVAAAVLGLIAALAPVLGDWGLAALFGLASAGIGCSYPVTQITVQMAGGNHRLGAAAASVQFFRTFGAAIATALLGTLLFGTLALTDGALAALFTRLVREGPGLLETLDPGARTALREALGWGFRAAFLGAAALLALGSYLAVRVPLQRL
ncbi:MFS transporter [Siccirubricoccus phaeus]|uniref:MFS transporter n=1 Tax=Siccirubricoccus phaeus TaxID=2595053 RepID=UPI00165B69AB|nr:MFS transporter [Siccirubricoccus phaeus]